MYSGLNVITIGASNVSDVPKNYTVWFSDWNTRHLLCKRWPVHKITSTCNFQAFVFATVSSCFPKKHFFFEHGFPMLSPQSWSMSHHVLGSIYILLHFSHCLTRPHLPPFSHRSPSHSLLDWCLTSSQSSSVPLHGYIVIFALLYSYWSDFRSFSPLSVD